MSDAPKASPGGSQPPAQPEARRPERQFAAPARWSGSSRPLAPSAPPAPSAPAIVRHPGCPQWGLGVLIEERDEKRIYEFEDGLQHPIAKAFWTKLEAVELPDSERAALESKLKGTKNRSDAPRKKARPRTPLLPAMTFDDQIARFAALFPGGFLGETYVREERGSIDAAPADGAVPARAKKGKGTREQAFAAAKELLAKDALTSMVAEGKLGEILARVRQVHQAAGNLLHPLGDVIPFSKMPAELEEPVARALVDVLHGDGDFAPRFDRYVAELAKGKLNTWPLATVLTALFDPGTHLFVKPSFFEKQAGICAFALGEFRTPSAPVYARMVELASTVEGRLRERDLAPRDKMDLYTFIWRTTAPPKKDPPPKKEKVGKGGAP